MPATSTPDRATGAHCPGACSSTRRAQAARESVGPWQDSPRAFPWEYAAAWLGAAGHASVPRRSRWRLQRWGLLLVRPLRRLRPLHCPGLQRSQAGSLAGKSGARVRLLRGRGAPVRGEVAPISAREQAAECNGQGRPCGWTGLGVGGLRGATRTRLRLFVNHVSTCRGVMPVSSASSSTSVDEGYAAKERRGTDGAASGGGGRHSQGSTNQPHTTW